jgi:hypothetical protein
MLTAGLLECRFLASSQASPNYSRYNELRCERRFRDVDFDRQTSALRVELYLLVTQFGETLSRVNQEV